MIAAEQLPESPIKAESRPGETSGREGCESICSALLVKVYRLTGSEAIRSKLRRWIVALEGGEGYSLTIRRILRDIHGLDIGLYTSGFCLMKPQLLHRGTCIGRYSTVAATVRTFTRNHPRNTRSTHGVFYNPDFGKVASGPVRFNRLRIGHGTWLGHSAIVLPPTTEVGDGAVVLPGSVVYSNVPPYAVVMGSPAQVIGDRLSSATISRLRSVCWWEYPPSRVRSVAGFL